MDSAPIISYQHSPMSSLVYCATNGVNGWGGKRRVWAAFKHTGEMITWNANKRSCRIRAEQCCVSFFLCKIQGIETA